jgi:hypothetical protein
MKKKRWLYYTVIVGALPFIIRVVVFLFMASHDWTFLCNAIDFVFLGLTLNLTNVNELNSLRVKNIGVIWMKTIKKHWCGGLLSL